MGRFISMDISHNIISLILNYIKKEKTTGELNIEISFQSCNHSVTQQSKYSIALVNNYGCFEENSILKQRKSKRDLDLKFINISVNIVIVYVLSKFQSTTYHLGLPVANCYFDHLL